MTKEQLKLKTKLKLKRLNIIIDREVEWNFGYTPSNDEYFDKTLTERNEWLNLARKEFPDIWKDEINKR
jgi:hypothetical protein